MVRTWRRSNGAEASFEMAPDSTSSRRQEGKPVKGFYRQAAVMAVAADDEEEPSTSEWPASATNNLHVSSVAAEAAKLVAPFVSITPTSPESGNKSFSSIHSRVFHDAGADTLEVRPVAAPTDFRASYLEPTSTTTTSSERRKRRSNVLDEDDSVLRRCLRRRDNKAWSKVGDLQSVDDDGDDDDYFDQSVPKKRAFMRPLYSKKLCSTSTIDLSEPVSAASSSSSTDRRKRRPSILHASKKSLKRRMRRHEREMISSDDDDDVDLVDISSTEDDDSDTERPPGDRVAYIHVGEGGEADLEAQLKGADNLDIQILEEESLPDIDETDMIHGLDHTGTARDYVDERHRCTVNCPVGCQGHLRPNEIVIYESYKWNGKLLGRRR
jgi:hypothetical protein